MTFWEKVKLVLSKIWEILEPAIIKILTEGGRLALELALKYVLIVAENMKDAEWTEKLKEANRLIKEEARLRGFELATSLINKAIEYALDKLKKDGKIPA